MKHNPFDDFFCFLPGPPDQRSNWLWNSFHPHTLFCVLCAIASMLLAALLSRGG